MRLQSTRAQGAGPAGVRPPNSSGVFHEYSPGQWRRSCSCQREAWAWAAWREVDGSIFCCSACAQKTLVRSPSGTSNRAFLMQVVEAHATPPGKCARFTIAAAAPSTALAGSALAQSSAAAMGPPSAPGPPSAVSGPPSVPTQTGVPPSLPGAAPSIAPAHAPVGSALAQPSAAELSPTLTSGPSSAVLISTSLAVKTFVGTLADDDVNAGLRKLDVADSFWEADEPAVTPCSRCSATMGICGYLVPALRTVQARWLCLGCAAVSCPRAARLVKLESPLFFETLASFASMDCGGKVSALHVSPCRVRLSPCAPFDTC